MIICVRSCQKPQAAQRTGYEAATPSSHTGGGNLAELDLTISTGREVRCCMPKAQYLTSKAR